MSPRRPSGSQIRASTRGLAPIAAAAVAAAAVGVFLWREVVALSGVEGGLAHQVQCVCRI